MDQDGARSLARDAQRLAQQVGHRAVGHGCRLTDPDDPSVPELVLEAIRVQLERRQVLADAS